MPHAKSTASAFFEMHTVAFRFGANLQHELKMENYLLGSEKFYVDGNLVLSKWSLIPNASREFMAGGHRITIQTAVTLKRVQMDGYVDGKLVAPDLFAGFNAKIAALRAKRAQRRFPILVLWTLIVIVSYLAFRSMHVR